jgi:hypothetical protein
MKQKRENWLRTNGAVCIKIPQAVHSFLNLDTTKEAGMFENGIVI